MCVDHCSTNFTRRTPTCLCRKLHNHTFIASFTFWKQLSRLATLVERAHLDEKCWGGTNTFQRCHNTSRWQIILHGCHYDLNWYGASFFPKAKGITIQSCVLLLMKRHLSALRDFIAEEASRDFLQGFREFIVDFTSIDWK